MMKRMKLIYIFHERHHKSKDGKDVLKFIWFHFSPMFYGLGSWFLKTVIIEILLISPLRY